MNIEPTTNYQHTQVDNENYDATFFDHLYKNILYRIEEIGLLPFKIKSLGNLLISAIISAIFSSFKFGDSNYNIPVGSATYLDPSNSHVLESYDHYTHTTNTCHPKPKPVDNDSSFYDSPDTPSENRGSPYKGGGVSPGGHSHSGGGRSF